MFRDDAVRFLFACELDMRMFCDVVRCGLWTLLFFARALGVGSVRGLSVAVGVGCGVILVALLVIASLPAYILRVELGAVVAG